MIAGSGPRSGPGPGRRPASRIQQDPVACTQGSMKRKRRRFANWDAVTPLVLHQVYYFENINEPPPGGYDNGLASNPGSPGSQCRES